MILNSYKSINQINKNLICILCFLLSESLTMSSIKQEVSAILMDYQEQIPDQVYIDILKRLSNIPNHKDPKKAVELQREVDQLQIEKDELEINLMDTQIQVDIHEEEIERLYNSIDLINERLGNFYIDNIIDETESTVTFMKIQDGEENVETRTIDILSDENGTYIVDDIGIHDDSLDNESKIDWFDETLDEYYSRRKNEIKNDLVTLQTIRRMKSVNYTLNNLIGHQLIFNNTSKFVFCVSTYMSSVNNEHCEKNMREQKYNRNLTKTISNCNINNITGYYRLM